MEDLFWLHIKYCEYCFRDALRRVQSSKSSYDTTAIICARDGDGSSKSGQNPENGKKWLDSGYPLR